MGASEASVLKRPLDGLTDLDGVPEGNAAAKRPRIGPSSGEVKKEDASGVSLLKRSLDSATEGEVAAKKPRIGTISGEVMREDASGLSSLKRPLDAATEEEVGAKRPRLTFTRFQPRGYQVRVYDVAVKRNTIAVLDTGAGKTMIAVMLMMHQVEEMLTAGEHRIIIFLAPSVPLVLQQFQEIKKHSGLRVACFRGAKGSDRSSREGWAKKILDFQVIVMTPQILLDALRSAFFTLDSVQLLIFDECHHASGSHPYSRTMKEFYRNSTRKPKIFGMTASPIKKKGVSTAGGCEEQLSELESTLDSKIYVVSDRSEMIQFVPSAKEKNRYYDGNKNAYLDLRENLEALKNKFDASLSCVVEIFFSVSGDPFKALKKKIYSSYTKICHCLDDLGLICAFQAAEICVEAVGDELLKDSNNFSRKCIEKCNAFHEEVMHAIGSTLPEDWVDYLKVESGNMKAVHAGYISPKLDVLIKILDSFRKEPAKQVACLVFMERKITAKVIVKFLKNLSHLSHCSAAFVTGGSSGGSSSIDSVSAKEQQETLNRFRSGEVNTLFTTDVAEEGLHIPDCSCVIRFDLPRTVRSYVQSRGRARAVGSFYIHMVERGNTQQTDALLELMLRNQSVLSSASKRDPNSRISEVSHDEVTDMYCIELTGATVNLNSSITLIYKYCEKLPRDRYYKPKPDFHFTKIGDSYQCILKLPDSAALRTLTGSNGQSMHIAKQLVCLDACRMLHKLGALNDHLLPHEETLEVEHAENTEGSTSNAGTTKRKELHEVTRAHALAGTWALKKGSVTLQGYKIKFVCNQADQKYFDFVLLIDSTLDDDVGSLVMDLYLVDKFVKASICPCGPIHLEEEQVEQAKLFQEFFFNGLFGKLFTGSKFSGTKREFLLMEDKRSPWSALNMYLILPLAASCVQGLGVVDIDWSGISAVNSVIEFMRSLYPSEEAQVPMPSINKMSENGHASDEVHLANGSLQPNNLKDTVVLAIHTGKIYTVVELAAGTSAHSPFESGSKSTGFSTFADFFSKKYDISLQYPEQAMLFLKHSHNPHNLLFSKSYSDAKISRSDDTTVQNQQAHVYIPPELLAHVDVSKDVLRSFYLIPSLMYRLESLILASQLRKEIASSTGNYCISASLILEAITTLRGCEDFSLERLELLGDSILKFAVSRHLFMKFPYMHEGQLTSRRSHMICNAMLHKLATKCNLQSYIRDAAFEPRRWLAPGQLSSHPVPCTCGVNDSEASDGTYTSDKPIKITYETKDIVIGKCCDNGHRWLCSKTISDCVEALIGAYYISGGLTAAVSLLKWFGMNLEVEPQLIEDVIKDATLRDCGSKLEDIKALELKLGYIFSVKGHCLEAITHGSYNEGTSFCYQRLEFLGDATLDLLITWYLFNHHKDVDPGDLTDLRSASVSNEHFAHVAVRQNIYKHLLHNSELIFHEINDFVNALEKRIEGLSPSSITVPKVLGDIVESIAAAVLVDTNLDLDRVWKVFEPLLSPFVTPEKLELPPLRQLLELCDQLGYFLNTKITPGKGETVVAELEVQLHTTYLARQGTDKNKKAAKGQAASLLLKAFEKEGLHHSRMKRKSDEISSDPSRHKTDVDISMPLGEGKLDKSMDNCRPKQLKEPELDGMDICSPESPKKKPKLDESMHPCHPKTPKLIAPVPLSIRLNKGGPRCGIFELCKKSKWPAPTFEFFQEKQCKGSDGLNFTSRISIHLPDSPVIRVTGDRCLDKKSAQDSAALAALYQLEKQGSCDITCSS